MFSGITGYLYVSILQCNETQIERDPNLDKQNPDWKV